jgi:hypothetical protein
MQTDITSDNQLSTLDLLDINVYKLDSTRISPWHPRISLFLYWPRICRLWAMCLLWIPRGDMHNPDQRGAKTCLNEDIKAIRRCHAPFLWGISPDIDSPQSLPP